MTTIKGKKTTDKEEKDKPEKSFQVKSMQAPLDHEILYNALRNIESKSVKEVKSELFRVSLDIFRA